MQALTSAMRFVVAVSLATSASACGAYGFEPRAGDLQSSSVQGTSSRAYASGQSRTNRLIYIIYTGSGYIAIYNWDGTYTRKLLGPLNAPEGACSDRNGDVFITSSGSSTIVEFAHGGTEPIGTLSDPGEYPAGCSVDPISGHLAVINYLAAGGGRGSVSIYKNTNSGTLPKTYTDQEIYAYGHCAYDSHGNLFIDGTRTAKRGFKLAELPHGSSSFKNNLAVSLKWPGPLEWDGRYMALGVPNKSLIYRISNGKVVAKVRLHGDAGYDFVIAAGEIATLYGRFPGNVGFWNYPAGGAPIRRFSLGRGPNDAALYMTVSATPTGAARRR